MVFIYMFLMPIAIKHPSTSYPCLSAIKLLFDYYVDLMLGKWYSRGKHFVFKTFT